jgi:acetyl-CoA C-acetyltransferase
MATKQAPQVRKVAIIGGNRIPFARSNGPYAKASNQDMFTAALDGLVSRFSLHDEVIGEVAAGAVLKHSRDFNLARESVLGSRLSPATPASDVQMACGTGLQAIINVGNKIALGQIESAIAGGVDTTSDAPLAVNDDLRRILVGLNAATAVGDRLKLLAKIRPQHIVPDLPRNSEPRTGLSMGEHAALTAKVWDITREAQDELAAASHQRLAAAYDRGFFDDLVTPYLKLTRDQNLRADATTEKLGKLKPVFGGPDGTMSPGNSTPLTDGASTVLLATEEWAAERRLPVLAYLTFSRTAAVDYVHGGARSAARSASVEDGGGRRDGMTAARNASVEVGGGRREGLLMAPAYAVPELLAQAGVTLRDFDFYEIHEAFASQVLATLKAWENPAFAKEKLGLDAPLGPIDRSKLNVNGSSLAAGHPFAATGGRIVATLAKLLDEKGSGRGLISICAAGGQGVTAILEK